MRVHTITLVTFAVMLLAVACKSRTVSPSDELAGARTPGLALGLRRLKTLAQFGAIGTAGGGIVLGGKSAKFFVDNRIFITKSI